MRDRHDRKVNQMTLGIDLFAWVLAFLAGLLIRYGSFAAVKWDLYSAVFLCYCITYTLIYYARTHRRGHYPADQKTLRQNIDSSVKSFTAGFTCLMVLLVAGRLAQSVSRLALFYMGCLLLPLMIAGRLAGVWFLHRRARRRGALAEKKPSSLPTVSPADVLSDPEALAGAKSAAAVFLEDGENREEREEAIRLLHREQVDVLVPLKVQGTGKDVPLPIQQTQGFAGMACILGTALGRKTLWQGIPVTLASAEETASAFAARPEDYERTYAVLAGRGTWKRAARMEQARIALQGASVVLNTDPKTAYRLAKRAGSPAAPVSAAGLLAALLTFGSFSHTLVTESSFDQLPAPLRVLFAFLPPQNRLTEADLQHFVPDSEKTLAILWLLLEDAEVRAMELGPVDGTIVIACHPGDRFLPEAKNPSWP